MGLDVGRPGRVLHPISDRGAMANVIGWADRFGPHGSRRAAWAALLTMRVKRRKRPLHAKPRTRRQRVHGEGMDHCFILSPWGLFAGEGLPPESRSAR